MLPRKKILPTSKTVKRNRAISWFTNIKEALSGTLTANKRKADFFLLFLIFLLTIFGLIMVFDSSIVEANIQFHDKFHYLRFQAAYFIIGWIGLLIISRIDYHVYKKFIFYFFVANILFLIIILIPGVGLQIKGARRWFDLGPTTYQPSETFKIILVLYLSLWLEKKRTLGQFFALTGFILGLVVLEPDLGTTIVLMATAFIMYYVSGAPIVKFASAIAVASILGLLLIFTSPYRRDRFSTFLNPHSDPLGSSYHVQQILLSLGSGGFTGLGIGQSKQKYQYLPEATTDSIFAIIGEEVGFIGSVVFISAFMAIIWKGFQIAQRASDTYGRLIATGITTWLASQTFINLASMVSLVPLTGVPLPFISYGGSSLIVCLWSIGILLNISKQID